MTNYTEQNKSEKKVFPAQAAKIISSIRIAVNRGSEDKIKLNQKVLLYSLSDEEIQDPETGESLGYLEIYKGTGKVIAVQEKLSVIESDRDELTEALVKSMTHPLFSPNFSPGFPKNLTKGNKIPFENPQVGDFIKPI
ncbi:MAG: hypothetical protein AAFQ14_16345 [Cyanobacteria bacterium J06621_12]